MASKKNRSKYILGLSFFVLSSLILFNITITADLFCLDLSTKNLSGSIIHICHGQHSSLINKTSRKCRYYLPYKFRVLHTLQCEVVQEQDNSLYAKFDPLYEDEIGKLLLFYLCSIGKFLNLCRMIKYQNNQILIILKFCNLKEFLRH